MTEKGRANARQGSGLGLGPTEAGQPPEVGHRTSARSACRDELVTQPRVISQPNVTAPSHPWSRPYSQFSLESSLSTSGEQSCLAVSGQRAASLTDPSCMHPPDQNMWDYYKTVSCVDHVVPSRVEGPTEDEFPCVDHVVPPRVEGPTEDEFPCVDHVVPPRVEGPTEDEFPCVDHVVPPRVEGPNEDEFPCVDHVVPPRVEGPTENEFSCVDHAVPPRVEGPTEDEFPEKKRQVSRSESTAFQRDWPPGGDDWNCYERFPEPCCHHHAEVNPPHKPLRRKRLTESDFVYNMSHARRGLAVIINNRNFHPATRIPYRIGSDVDARNLNECLSKLGFEVSIFDDLTARQMIYVMKNCALTDHSDADCFVCVILSHGDVSTVYGTDQSLTTAQLALEINAERCPTLAGKPKLFIIQASRGSQLDAGVNVSDDTDGVDGRGRFKQRLPVMGDFLFSYSTAEGYFSWQTAQQGSWFVKALCQVFIEHGTTRELLWLLTRIHNMVATRSNTIEPYLAGMKQMPSFVTMLAKHIYFTPKPGPDSEQSKAGASY